MKRMKLPVRKIVELVLRCGDIDSRYVDSSTMYQGAAAHRKIQKTMGDDYQKEVSLKLDTEISGTPVTINGRADGIIITDDGSITVDEIKTTTLPLHKLYEQRRLHIGQAQCYAYMLLQTIEHPPQEIMVQLTYYQLDTGELERHQVPFTIEEIGTFFTGLLADYSIWMQYESRWKEIRNQSIHNQAFPFPAYRKGQRELAVASYRAIVGGQRLYAQAPTGIGKTLSSLFPSIKAMGEEQCSKLFYLTAKTVTRGVAEDAVGMMTARGLRFKSVTLRAKDKICFCEETVCNPEACRYAKGHYDRVNEAIIDILDHEDLITPVIVEKYAARHTVCPFEYTLDIALWTDLVICDYNHVFDPVVYLKRFFDGAEENDYVFLVDEAHNLVDRVRSMYSAEVKKSTFLHLRRDLNDNTHETVILRRAMQSVNQYLLDLRKELVEQKGHVRKELDEVLSALLKQFIKAAEEWMALPGNQQNPVFERVLEEYFNTSLFLLISDLYNSHYTTIIDIVGSEVTVTLFCLDPSEVIGEKLGQAKASVLFSATLTPLPYYREILGGREQDKVLSLPSPFPQEHLLLAAHGGISTKYQNREESYMPISRLIYDVISRKQGNYLVFFPSYDYLNQVYERFSEAYPQIKTLLQDSRMEEEEREAFMARFDAENEETLVGFCVLGGIFSEGIDLKGKRLIGSVIIGVGLPRISLRQDLIREYFHEKNGKGYDYAYVFPGMNKVLQAAGRVIRSETDYGTVVLVDTRFHTRSYRALYPRHWQGIKMVRHNAELEDLLEQFPYFNGS